MDPETRTISPITRAAALGCAGTHDPVADAIRAWPGERPLAILTAGTPQTQPDGTPTRAAKADEAPQPGWTILASPTAATPIRSPADLDRLLADRQTIPLSTANSPPFRHGRLLALSYSLGAAFEPTAATRAQTDSPLGWVLDCPETFAFDHATSRWTEPAPPRSRPICPPGFTLRQPSTDPDAQRRYCEMVARALEYIRAGDVYQVNIAHRLTMPFDGSPRALMAALLSTATPRHGFYAELPGAHKDAHTALCSASPELFLAYDPRTRAVRTQPMKGTRPIGADPEELRASPKDRAELDMITDLMRNDLGRVCAFGSVRVEAARTIEAHASSVWQATSTVSGKLRAGLSAADLVRATFPPGSITGAPKVRAMQIIDELEPTPRGYYCGALGWLDDSGAMSLNVAIRTATVSGGTLHYHTGAGIVADSDPTEEWAETCAKAAVLLASANSPC